MPQYDRAQLPEPLATGTLEKRPLAHLLIYAEARLLTGSFLLEHGPDEIARIHVVAGKLSRVATSASVIYLGHVLYEMGALSGPDLSASLAEVARSKSLHGQVLLRKRIIGPEQLADALRTQRARKLHHAFSLPPETTFAFFAGVDLVGPRPDDVEPVDPMPSVWRGIQAYPAWRHIEAALDAVAGRPLRVTAPLDRLGLTDAEKAAVESLRRTPGTVRTLATRAVLDAKAAERLAYFLVITRSAEITERVGISVPPESGDGGAASARPGAASGGLGAALGSGEYVRKMSFAMRAVSPDTQGLRIPSPMPSRLFSEPPPRVRTDPHHATGRGGTDARPGAVSHAAGGRTAPTTPSMPAVPPRSEPNGRPVSGPVTGPATLARPRTSPDPIIVRKRPSHEAEHALSQAEMHFVLGEREEAVRFVREALVLALDWVDAQAFLVHLEAVAVPQAQPDEAKLRVLLRRIDAVIDVDPLCRRGRYYRALLRSRLADHEGAIRDLRMAVTNDPNNIDAQRELAAYARRVRMGLVELRSMSPLAGMPAVRLPTDPARGKP